MNQQVITKQFEIPGANSEVIRGDIRVIATTQGATPTIIFCHGFKGFKDWGCWPYLAAELAAAGFYVVTFNFSHNGIGQALDRFTELELFRNNTFSIEAEDLGHVLEAIEKNRLPEGEQSDSGRIGLIGHSRGGAAAVCVGAVCPQVKAVATLGAISSICNVTPEIEAKWRQDGEYSVKNMRTGERLPLGLPLLEDMLSGRERIEQAAKKLRKPLLIIHGDEDEAVPVKSAYELKSWAPNSKVALIKGGTHTFGATHPFIAPSAQLRSVIDMLNEFFSVNIV